VAVPFGAGHTSLNTGSAYNHPFSKNLHNGLDYLVDAGTEIIAPASGRVVIDTWQPIGGGGRMVVVDAGADAQGNRIFYLIAHLSQSFVSQGQLVLRGDPLGRTGNSGGQPVSHLHFSAFTSQSGKVKSRLSVGFFLGDHDVLDPAMFALGGGVFPPFDSQYLEDEASGVFYGFSHPLCAIP
jgi:murein DD-endopeptidase MepM/ murein hydrolase activator NlpD